MLSRRVSSVVHVLVGMLVVGLGAQALAATATTTTSVFTVPSSIDATGATDVSAQMAVFLKSVPDGSTVQLASGGSYRMESTLVLQSRHDLTIDGMGATVFATTPGDHNRANVRVLDSSGIVIGNLAIKGANPNAGMGDNAYDATKEGQHGLELLSVNDSFFYNLSITDVYGDFVYFGKSYNGDWSTNVVLANSRLARSGRQGVSLLAARRILLYGNTTSDVRRATIDFEPNGPSRGVDGVQIMNNDFGKGRLLLFSADSQSAVNNVTIANNRLHGMALQAWISQTYDLSGYRDNWRITGNTSDVVFGSASGSAIYASNVRGLTVTGNTQAFDPRRNMVVANVANSCSAVVQDNQRPGSVGESRIAGTC